jgi:hypothetical protein
MESEAQATALFRQRRFLVLMSLVVIAYYALGGQPKDEAEYSGFALRLTRPEALEFVLWIVWAWALLRYAQHVYELFPDLRKEVLADVYREDERMALARAKKYGQKLADAGGLGDLQRPNVRVHEVKFKAPTGNPDQRKYVYTTAKDGSRSYNVGATATWGTAAEPGGGSEDFQMVMTRPQVRWLRCRAWFHSALRRTAFGEHFFPLLLSFATPFALLLRSQATS